jgi:hypothetical protein
MIVVCNHRARVRLLHTALHTASPARGACRRTRYSARCKRDTNKRCSEAHCSQARIILKDCETGRIIFIPRTRIGSGAGERRAAARAGGRRGALSGGNADKGQPDSMFAAIAAYRPPAPPGAPRPSAHGAEGAPPRRGVVRVGPPGPGGRLAGRFSAGVGRTDGG